MPGWLLEFEQSHQQQLQQHVPVCAGNPSFGQDRTLSCITVCYARVCVCRSFMPKVSYPCQNCCMTVLTTATNSGQYAVQLVASTMAGCQANSWQLGDS